MLIAGAKGFARQLLEVICQLGYQNNCTFFDDYDPSILKFYQYDVLKSLEGAGTYFQTVDRSFALGLGNPRYRSNMAAKLEFQGGELVSLVSPKASISPDSFIGKGSCILTGSNLGANVSLGKGTLINLRVLIGNDVRIGDFSEIAPGAIVSSGSSVGEFSFLGAGAIIGENVHVGRYSIVGSGAVVMDHVPDYALVVGVPARVIKFLA